MQEKGNRPNFKEIYPELAPDELKEARENLDEYLRLIWAISQRIKAEAQDVKLTARGQPVTMKSKRSV